MGYPPYSDMFQVVFSGKNESIVRQAAEKWHGQLEEMLPEGELQIFRPQPAPMNKIKETYRWCMLIKSPQGKRRMAAAALERIKENDKSKKNEYAVTVDINPYSFI